MSTEVNVSELLEAAQDDGVISKQSSSALAVPDIGAQIQAALGADVDDLQVSGDVVLVTIMPDDSGSIRFAGNAQLVRDGHNLVIDSLKSAKKSTDILIHTRYLNGEILSPYCEIDSAVPMDSKNYNPDMGTPLYDQTVIVLGTVLAKSQEFSDNGIPVRTVTLLITDGQDEHSVNSNERDVKSIVQDMLKTESHIIAGMEIDDGAGSCRGVFKDMGIPDEWILTPGQDEQEIRKAFQLFSQSAVKASQNAGSFSQVALGGGFTN